MQKKTIYCLLLLLIQITVYAQHDYRMYLQYQSPHDTNHTWENDVIINSKTYTFKDMGDTIDFSLDAIVSSMKLAFKVSGPYSATYNEEVSLRTDYLKDGCLYCIDGNSCVKIETWLSPDLKLSHNATGAITYDNTVTLTPSADGYTGKYNIYVCNSAGTKTAYLGTTSSTYNVKLANIMDELNSIGGIGIGSEVPVYFMAKFPSYDFKNKSAKVGPVYFTKPSIELKTENNTVCWNEAINLSTNLAPSGIDWYVSVGSGPFTKFKTNTSNSISTTVNELKNAGIPIITKDATLYFVARRSGKTFNETLPKNTEYYGDPLPVISVDSVNAACDDKPTGKLIITVASNTGTKFLNYGVYPLDDDNKPIDTDISNLQTNSSRSATFENLPGDMRYEIQVQNIADSIEDITGKHSGSVRCASKTYKNIDMVGPPVISETLTTVKSTKCSYSSDGEIDVDLSFAGNGGTYNYKVHKTGIDTIINPNGYFTGLEYGTYSILVADIHGCKSDAITKTVKQKPELVFNSGNPYILHEHAPSNLHIRCKGDTNGSITINASGGTPFYKYSFDGGTTYQDTNFKSGFAAGTHSLKIRDFNACTTSVKTVILNEADSAVHFRSTPYDTTNLLANGYAVSCFAGKDGKIEAFAGGGWNPENLQYSLDNVNFSGNLFEGLKAGNYTIWVQDQNGCKDSTGLFSLSSPSAISPILDPVKKHHGYGVTCINETDTDSYDGVLKYKLSGGMPGYEMAWNGGAGMPTPVSDSITGINAGTYYIGFTDLNGCDTTMTVIIDAPPVISTIIDTLETPYCYDEYTGWLTVKAQNGLAPYSFSINGTDFYTNNTDTFTFTGLHANSYNVTVRDANYQDMTKFEVCQGNNSHILPEKEQVELGFVVTNPFCNGDFGNIIASVASGPGDSLNYSYEWRKEGSIEVLDTDSILNNQPLGAYQLTVFDEQGCARPFGGLEITEPMKLEFLSINKSNTTCPEINNGSISINMNLGGTPPLQYSIDGGLSFNNDPFFDSLSAGVFHVIVQDDNGCQLDSIITIENGKIEAIIESTQMVSCNGADDGFFNLSGTGGQGIYEYSIDNGATFSTVNEFYVNAGNYPVQVRDVNTGCLSSVTNLEITEPDLLEVTALLVDSSACGQYLGEAGYIVSGGSGSIDAKWYPLGSSVPLTASKGLLAGTYIIEIEDQNSSICTDRDTLFVPEREAPEITRLSILSQPWCNKPLGEVEVTASGGSPTYSYLWNDAQNQSSHIATGLYADSVYSVVVSDIYNCFDDTTIVLSDGPAIEVSHTTIDAACGQADGSATLSVTGGLAPYKYKWHDSIDTDTLLVSGMSGLFAGEYTVSISDKVGCAVDYPLDISNNGTLGLTVTNIQKSYCELPTGLASVAASGGVPGYSYSWSKVGESALVSADSFAGNLSAGEYRAKVTDSRGCIVYTDISISDSIELEPSLAITEIVESACNKNLGSATAEMTGGLAPYTYQWNTTENNTHPQCPNLYSGTYTVTVADARGCVQTTTATIVDRPDPELFYIEQTPSACGKALGTVKVGIREGFAPYSCSVDGKGPQKFEFTYNPESGNYEAVVTGLLAGATPYSLSAIDSNACVSNSVQAVIEDRPDMEIRLVDVAAVSCYGGHDGLAEISVINGTAPFTYNWFVNDDDSSYSNKLPAYENRVEVIDANGCLVTRTVEIPTPDSIYVTNTEKTIPHCYGGSDGRIAVSVSGGNFPYTFEWDNGQDNSSADNITAGSHSVTIMDAKGCIKEYTTELLNPDKIENTGITKENLLCEGQKLTLDPGEDYVSCTWNSDNGFSSNEKVITVGENGEYYLEATTTKGCIVTDTIFIETSTSLLTAEFLMQSEAFTGDTVAIIEVSWPVPDRVEWNFPEEATLIASNGEHELLRFATEGNYYVELTAHLAECTDMVGKYIDVIRDPMKRTKEFTGEGEGFMTFEISPNPNKGKFKVQVELKEAAPVIFEVISINGAVQTAEYIDNGLTAYDIEVNLPGLKPGIYLVNLKANGENSPKTFIVY